MHPIEIVNPHLIYAFPSEKSPRCHSGSCQQKRRIKKVEVAAAEARVIVLLEMGLVLWKGVIVLLEVGVVSLKGVIVWLEMGVALWKGVTV